MIRNVGMQNLGFRGTAYFNDAKTGNAVGINIDKVLMMQKQEGNFRYTWQHSCYCIISSRCL